MKKVFVTLAIITTIVACGSNDGAASTDSTGTPTTGPVAPDTGASASAAPAATDLSSNPDYQAGLALTAQSDCATCHKIDEKLIGPSFREIAAKYPSTDDNVKMLASKIITGGSGVWGQVPMTAHPQVTQEDAEAMVKYVLLLKK